MNRGGQVVLKLMMPYRDGTSNIVMSPLEFMQRPAALVPRPRLHLIRFHGVLAPHAKLRAAIVPIHAQTTSEHATDCAYAHGAPARMSWARLLKRVDRYRTLPAVRGPPEDHRCDPSSSGKTAPKNSSKMSSRNCQAVVASCRRGKTAEELDIIHVGATRERLLFLTRM